jgi:hypothetical protein
MVEVKPVSGPSGTPQLKVDVSFDSRGGLTLSYLDAEELITLLKEQLKARGWCRVD